MPVPDEAAAARPRRRRSTAPRIGMWSAAAAVTAAAVVTGVVLSGPHGTPGTTTRAAPHAVTGSRTAGTPQPAVTDGIDGSGATTLLVRAAVARTRTGDVTPAAGQYTYIRVVGPAPGTADSSPAAGTSGSPRAYSLTEYWIPRDQTQEWLRRDTVVGQAAPGYPLEFRGLCGDFYAHTQDGSQGRTPGDACTRPADFGNPSPAFLATLPRDPSRLLAQLTAYAQQRVNPSKQHDENAIVLTTVNGLLSTGMIPADLTASLYHVLSGIPGVSVVPDTKNAAGASGTGFRFSSTVGAGTDTSPETETVIVDLASGTYLGYHDVSEGVDYLNAVSVGVADSLGGGAA